MAAMRREDGRRSGELREISFEREYTRHAPGSVLARAGQTVVLCTASLEEGVPAWRAGSGMGWVTAEYDMLPASTHQRRKRNRGQVDGRSQEIQRLIGRAVRAVVDFEVLGENTILLDCDVLQADGGTRTTSINGAYVAFCDAVAEARRRGWFKRSPIRAPVAAVSVGLCGGRCLLDLNYAEDVAADVDLNVVMTGRGEFVEVQGTGEKSTFSREDLEKMVGLATRGIRKVISSQRAALRKPLKRVRS